MRQDQRKKIQDEKEFRSVEDAICGRGNAVGAAKSIQITQSWWKPAENETNGPNGGGHKT